VRTVDVAPLTEILKVTSIASVVLALFVSAWSLAADPSSIAVRYWNRYTTALEQRLRPMFNFTPGRHIALGQCAVAFLVVTLHVLFTVELWWALMVIIAAAPMIWIELQRRKRVELIEEQLDNFVLALANALKTTPSIGAAFNSVAVVIQDPIKQEVELALKEMKVGSTLDQSLLHMAARVRSRQLDSALSAILIGRQVGGNLPKVLETTASSLREMRRLEGVVRTKTAEGRMQLWVIGALPAVIIIGLNFMWPGYFTPLQQSLMGYIIIFISVACWVVALVLARKVLAVDM
jgi:tight adherence protein B